MEYRCDLMTPMMCGVWLSKALHGIRHLALTGPPDALLVIDGGVIRDYTVKGCTHLIYPHLRKAHLTAIQCVHCSMSNAQRPDGLVVISDYKESIIKRSIKATHLTGININSSTGLHKTIEQHLFGYVYYQSKIRTFILLIACGTYLLTDMLKHMESRLVARDIGCLSRLSWVISRQHHASRQH